MPDMVMVVTVMAAILLSMLIIAVPLGLWGGSTILRRLDGIHLQLNSKMDKLLHAHGAAERAAGIEQERTDELARQRDKEKRLKP